MCSVTRPAPSLLDMINPKYDNPLIISVSTLIADFKVVQQHLGQLSPGQKEQSNTQSIV